MNDSPSHRHSWLSRLAVALLRGLLTAVVLTPPALHLLALPEYGRLQREDYYGVLRQIFDDEGRPAEPNAWWRASINYHRVAVPALIWGVNVALFDGHNLPTAVLGLFFLVTIAWLLASRMPPATGRGGRAPPEAWLLPAAMVSVLVLQPIAAHNVGRSFAAIHTYLAALVAVAVLVVVQRRAGPRPGSLWPLLPLAVVGPLTFSSELVTWPAALAGALLLRLHRRDVAWVAAAMALAIATYSVGRPPPVPADLPGPGLMLGFVGTFLGAPFGADLDTARVIGWVLLTLGTGALIAALVRSSDRRLPAFWGMVMLYAVGNGVLAALGRAVRFGEAGGLSVRYAIYPMLFLLATSACLICAGRRRRRAAWAVAAALALALVPIYGWGLRVMEIAVEQGRRQPLAELTLRLGLDQPRYLRLASSNERYLVSTVPLLEALGHVPFDRPPLRLPGPVVIGATATAEREVGRLAEVRPTVRPGLVYVAGWLELAEGAGGEVVFRDRYGRRTSAVSVYRPLDEPGTLRWEGFALWLTPKPAAPASAMPGRVPGVGTAYLLRPEDGGRIALGTSQRAREQIDRLAAARSDGS